MNWIKKNTTEILLGFLIVSILIGSFINYITDKKIYDKIEQISSNDKYNQDVNKLIEKINDSTLVINNPNYYLLRKEIISIKKESAILRGLVETKHNDWLSYFANFWAILGLLLGSIAVVFSFKEKIKKEVESKVALEVENETKSKVGLLKQQLNEIEKHKKYKTESNIIIINKFGAKFPDSFKAVLKLFKTDINDSKNFIEVENLSDLNVDNAIINKLKSADLVLIENMVSENIWDVKEYKSDYITLANNICDTTTLLYYGSGRLDTSGIDKDKQHFVSFVSASSQLYGNMLNLLKYKFELKS